MYMFEYFYTYDVFSQVKFGVPINIRYELAII